VETLSDLPTTEEAGLPEVQVGVWHGLYVPAETPDEIVEALLDIRTQAAVPVEFVARSHLPLLAYDAQLELMRQLAEDVAPHV